VCFRVIRIYAWVKLDVYVFIYIYTLFIEEAYLAYFTTLIYHKVLINNNTEQDTEQDTTYRYDQRSRMPTPVAL